jgi:hypothetical protein
VIDEALRPEDKSWVAKFVLKFEVPQYAVRGTYKIPVTIRDDVAGKEIAGELDFRVRGEEAPPEGVALGIRNFRFLAKEDDRFALRPPVYKQGATLFARFDIIGYKFEGNNRLSVDYGISILGPPNAEGVAKSVYVQESAAEESTESFYPRRSVPAGFGLGLDEDVPAGEFTLVLTIRDKVSGETKEIREPFSVE